MVHLVTPALTSVHATRARTALAATPARTRDLAQRELAVLRIAARQGVVAVTVRKAGAIVTAAYDHLDVLAALSERGLLRYAGLRSFGEDTEIVYEA